MMLARTATVIATWMVYGLCLACVGCEHIQEHSTRDPEVLRPSEVLSFPALYQQNCSGCHGANGKNGAAISLANPVYLALAGEEHLREVVSKGVHGGLMPAFARSSGGTLTDQQVNVLVQGLVHQWGKPDLVAGQNPPTYAATSPGDAARGQEVYNAFCARCHGPTGEGNAFDRKGTSGKLGSIVDPSYLALISDQNLRSITIAGRPDEDMPDWRSDGSQPLTDQQITDVVAWMASKRVGDPGQPYLSKR